MGKNWTYCFIKKHSDHVKVYLSSPLDSKHGQAINPSTNAAWPKQYEGPELALVNPVAPDKGKGDNEGRKVFDLNVEGESSDGSTGSGLE